MAGRRPPDLRAALTQGRPSGKTGARLAPAEAQAEVELENEFRRLVRARKRIEKEIAAFEQSRLTIRPYRYVLNFAFDVSGLATGLADVGLFPSQTRAFTVREGTIFFAEELTFEFEAQGTLSSNSQNATIPLGPNGWKQAINFDWRVRDTGMNREWQNRALPASLLMSNAVNPLDAGNGHARLEGGAEVFFQVIPTQVIILIGANNPFDSVNAYNVEIVFGGQEVILEGAA